MAREHTGTAGKRQVRDLHLLFALPRSGLQTLWRRRQLPTRRSQVRLQSSTAAAQTPARSWARGPPEPRSLFISLPWRPQRSLFAFSGGGGNPDLLRRCQRTRRWSLGAGAQVNAWSPKGHAAREACFLKTERGKPHQYFQGFRTIPGTWARSLK